MILGIDVGGTHTDSVLVENFVVKKKAKVVTDNDDIMTSLLAAVQKTVSDENIKNIRRIVLSTTISTNAIVQGKTDRVGMVLQNGPGLSPQLLDKGKDSRFVEGYINHRGISIQPVNNEEIRDVGEYFRGENIQQIGITGKFSSRNPQHEIAIAGLLADEHRNFSLGHRLSGQLNFPRRVATTYLNAAVHNIYRGFVRQVQQFLREIRLDVPVYILKADGGTILINESLFYAALTIHSGPAASIMGVLATAGVKDDAVALDIGGTTTDISVFADGIPLLEISGVTIGGRKTLIRGLYTKSIGIGGDSAVRIKNGNITIGPDREGPAAALDGSAPTPTDAMIVLNRTALGSKQKATDAINILAKQLNMDVASAARVILDKAIAVIADNVRQVIEEINNKPVYTIHELLEGKVIRPRSVYVVGGPAAAIAPGLASLLGYPYKIPEHSEVANAVGAALARTTAEVTMLADTEKGELTIAEEGIMRKIPHNYSSSQAIEAGREALRIRAVKMGADLNDLEMEVTEAQEFNMIRDFYKTGKNIRTKMQIKPGLISACAARNQ
ncbi:MAG: hydantoinase [Deltaproteobacteria bacterium HGW-Deltaproteobacteria-12]|jgi:N-methylhydantoinase A/oxoprolinase/acetone carboxylase beta subunit|nr:MAG: hydantoinase [Deltaproteobacteria bacterium HGW-Deltaproteobacteria-12]